MADHPELAELAGAQAVALQRPYAADPGTLTGWLVKDTIGASDDEVLRILAATNAKYANVNAADVNVDVAANIIKELAEDVFAAESLETFLTVVIPEGGESTVMVISRLSRYRPELGVVSPWTGQGFGFLGEVEEGQLPPLVKLPDTMSLRQALAPKRGASTDVGGVELPFRSRRSRGSDPRRRANDGRGWGGCRQEGESSQATIHPAGMGPLFLRRYHTGASHEAYTTTDQVIGDRAAKGERGVTGAMVCCVVCTQRYRGKPAFTQQELHLVGVSGRGTG
ncbi:hypothetical protein MHU86_16804 [Fragilaria crotonensis]|nr:hypothetical protein MHU86_16804 [Fragilaria crotonensis]